ncbi:MAG TPA: AAA family ATPase [Deltaproteobacteria bacterium]|nr:AAA family ATPase [Deltaproteobacteria bacterium]
MQAADEPLASRLRPRTLDEIAGQQHIVGPGRLLRRAIEADQLSSVIFYGPPGTGKTTLARVIANRTSARFVAINAVLAGIKDLRAAVERARAQRTELFGKRTILFVDEVHRFNKAQQDALLPWVEDGTLILVGATTENPYFEVNKALVSRSRLFRLEPLSDSDLHAVLRRALTADAGYGARRVILEPAASEHLVDVANGDARALLNALELAVETTPEDDQGRIVVDLGVAEESIQRRAVLYDREGDAHFDTISAFIKSIRGSDPDASLYWLSRMVYAGEDPRFILRRLIILASEDVGLAAPEALSVVTAAAAAFDRVGMPEGRFHLAHATLFLAACPKSNSAMGFFDALAAVASERTGDVPVALKDPSRDAKGSGHGEGYLYPHAYRDHWVAQQYLPEALQGRIFWRPSEQGWEGSIRDEVQRRREAQLAAMVEPLSEPLSWSADQDVERWMRRSLGAAGGRLQQLRDAVFEVAGVERHHLVADLSAGTGLLLWEAVRRAPEGHAWARAADSVIAAGLEELARGLPELRRPRVVIGGLAELAEAARAEAVRFDRLVGRDALGDVAGWADEAAVLPGLLAPGGRLVLVVAQPARAQRLVQLAAWALPGLDPGLHGAWSSAEEAIYAELAEPGGDVEALAGVLTQAGLIATAEELSLAGELRVDAGMVERWLAATPDSWLGRLGQHLPASTKIEVAAAVRALVGRTVPWASGLGRVVARMEAT